MPPVGSAALRLAPVLVVAGALAATGCAARQDATLAPARVPAQRILVLTSQGVDPSTDTAGYNAFVVTPVEGTTWSVVLSSPDGADEGAASMADLARRLADQLASRGEI